MNTTGRAWSFFPLLVRYTGYLGVIFVSGVWLLTDRLNPALLAAFGAMMGIGEGLYALKELVVQTRAGQPPMGESPPPPPPERREHT